MKLRKLLFILPGAALINACSNKPAETAIRTEQVTIPVQVMSLSNSRPAKTYKISGQFTTDDEVNLSFKTGGIISKIYVKEGDAIKTGQLLATLDLTEIDAQVKQYEIGYDKANRDYERALKLFNDSVYTLEQLQNTKSSLDLAKQQLSVLNFNKRHSEIRANKSGYVLKKMASEGQLVLSGALIFQINGAKSGSWMLRAGISDKDWAVIKIKDEAYIYAGDNEVAYEGIVIRKSESVEQPSGLFTIDVKFTGSKPSTLAAGMFGTATVVVKADTSNQAKRNIAIPYGALLDGDGRSGYVFVTNDGKTAKRIKVEIEGVEKDSVIISKGQESSNSLIIMGSAYLTDNSSISIN